MGVIHFPRRAPAVPIVTPTRKPGPTGRGVRAEREMPDALRTLFRTPSILRSRAAVRREIAAQDEARGAHDAALRNLKIATHYEERADAEEAARG